MVVAKPGARGVQGWNIQADALFDEHNADNARLDTVVTGLASTQATVATLDANDPEYVVIGPSGGDDTAAISAAMDTAHTAGRVLFFKPGNYTCGLISKSYAPLITAEPGTVVITITNSSGWCWTFIGSLGATVALTADALRNTRTITCASTAGFAANDLVIVGDNQSPYATESTRDQGQMARVASVDSSTQLTLVESTYTSFAVSSSAVIAKVTAPDRTRIKGLRFYSGQAGATAGFIRTRYLRDVEIDIDGEGASAAGLRIEHTYDFKARTTARDYYDNTAANQFGYAVEVNGASAHGSVEVHATRTRHAFTCSGLNNERGEPLDIRVTGVAYGTSATAWDAHAQGCDILFDNCLAFGTGGYGFALRGQRQHIRGGFVQGGFGGVFMFDKPIDNSISGLRISDVAVTGVGDSSGAGGHGIRCTVDVSGLSINGCEFQNIARNGIYLNSTAADINIAGNSLRNVGKTGGGSSFQNAVNFVGVVTRGRVRDNSITDNDPTLVTTLAAFKVDATCVDTVFRDNDIQSGITRLTGSGQASVVTRLTVVDRYTPWLPTGAKQSTVPIDRIASIASAGLLSSGRLTLAGGMVLEAGVQINSISFVSGGTAAATPTNQWFCLIDQSLNILAKTVDNTTTAWALNSTKTLTISGGYTPAVDTPAYLGVMVAAATVPTLQSVGVSTAVGAITPMVAATANTGLTTPASLGLVGSLTGLALLAYGWVS